MRRWIGTVAGIGFVVVGAVELALTGGPAPSRDASRSEFVAFFTEEAAAAPAVAVLSAVAGALLLVFAAVLRGRIHDRLLAGLAWAAAIVTVALAFAGQAVQQAAWLTADTLASETVATLGGLLGFLFGFALVGGGVLAAASGIAAMGDSPLPVWLAALAALAVVVPLIGIANATVAPATFPAFLVWLLGASVALARKPGTPPETSDVPDAQPVNRTGSPQSLR